MEAILYEIWLLFFLNSSNHRKSIEYGNYEAKQQKVGCFIDLIQADFSFSSGILNVFMFPIPLAGHKRFKANDHAET